MRLRLILSLAALAVVPASAQVMQIQPIQRPPLNVTLQQDPDAARKVTTIEDAQAQIVKLRAEKRELSDKLNATLATLDEWTKKGGSLVHAYCESEEVSRNSSGATEDCTASGYRCSSVEGTCRRQCNVTTDCAGSFVCDTGSHVCVHP
ncbi:hypothetical protein [Sphingomonas sp. URHD0057]|uniref:hypothetical protein n=1 Tax=Sphingomonas sp. URHD0057 TaxID=1380389 RepID=UPI000B31793C|nr:hypothetical protein [Sphingomonas sp. URHD0057]